MSYYDELDRYVFQADLDRLAALADAEVHNDADLNWPEGAVAAVDAAAAPDGEPAAFVSD